MIVMNHFPVILVLRSAKKVQQTIESLLIMFFLRNLTSLVYLSLIIITNGDDYLYKNSSALMTEMPIVSLEDKIIRKLERLRRTMPVGNINRNIPILDPFVLNNVSIDFDVPNFRLNGLLDDVRISGLKFFYVDKLELHILPVQVDLDVTFPALEISGKYNLKGKISRFIPIFGKGKFSIKIHRILIENFLRVSLKKEFVKVLDFGLEPFVDGFQAKVTGILGSHVVSKVFSDIATALFPKIFQTLKNSIVQRISKIGLEFSKLLIGDDLTLKEIVYIIDNDNDGLLP